MASGDGPRGRRGRRVPRSRLVARIRRTPLPVLLFLLAIAGLGAAQLAVSIDEGYRRLFLRDFGALRSRSQPEPGRLEALRHWALARARSSVPELRIEIDPAQLQILSDKRVAARRKFHLFRSEGDLVPASIHYGGSEIKVRVRLKGDRIDHLNSPKWSLRIEVRGDDQLFGMRRFSLQAPKTRFHHHEALYLDHLRREGILAPRYFFAEVMLNRRRLGLMAVEEHFSRELLESQGRREGVILRYDETDLWRGYQQRTDWVTADFAHRRNLPQPPNDYDNWRTARVDSFRSRRVSRDRTQAAQSEFAVGALRGMSQNLLRPSQVLQVDRVAKLIALTELWGAWHPLRWHNLRFHLDPLTARIELIAFDGDVDDAVGSDEFVFQKRGKMHLLRHLLRDPVIRSRYLQHLRHYLSDDYLGELEDFLSDRESEYLAVLRSEYPGLPRFDFESIRRRKELRKKLAPGLFPLAGMEGRTSRRGHLPPPYSEVVYAYRVSEEGREHLELVNPLRVPVRVERLTVETGDEAGSRPPSPISGLPLTLQPSWPERPAVVHRLRLPGELPERAQAIRGVATALDRSYELEAREYFPALRALPFRERVPLADLLERHPFVSWKDGALRVAPGTWRVTQPLVVPPQLELDAGAGASEVVSGPPLILSPGVELQFGEGAFLLTHGPVHLMGTAEAPVVLSGVASRPWQGISVLESGQPSRWTHFEVRDTGPARHWPWELTGGVTFYRSEVSLSDGAFRGSRAEDALNLVRARFVLERVEFSDAASDAVDSDFSSGEISHCAFSRVAGDGADVMASQVQLADTSFDEIGDKAVSVGEASQLVASAVRIRGADIAVVGKDASSVILSKLRLSEIRRVGFATYMKKLEYAAHGPTSLVASGVEFDDSAPLAWSQEGSSLIVDGREMPADELDVEALYRPRYPQSAGQR